MELQSSCEVLNEASENDDLTDNLTRGPGAGGRETVESAAHLMEQVLQRSATHSAGSTSPSFFQGVRDRLQKKLKRNRNSSDNLVDDLDAPGNHSPEDNRSSSGSPPDGPSPVLPRKVSKGSGSGLLRINRKKGKAVAQKLKASASQPEKLGQEFSSKESSQSPPINSPTMVNGHEDVFIIGGSPLHQRLPKRDPSHKVSGPVIREKREAEGMSYNLQGLVLPLPKAWTKCGYLWLRMKLPNNIYAWTYIVSGVCVCGACVRACMRACVCVCVDHNTHL